MIKAVSLDVEDTLNNLSKGTDAAVEHMCDYFSRITGVNRKTIFREYQNIRQRVKRTYWQSPRRYDIAYRLYELSQHNGMDKITPYIKDFTDEFYEIERSKADLFPKEVDKFIRELAEKYKVGITSDSRHILFSNGSRRPVSGGYKKPWLYRVGVNPTLLDFNINIEEVGNKTKRTGYPFKVLIRELRPMGIEPGEIVHVGDSENSDIIPARKLGINAILFSPNEKSFDQLLEEIYKLDDSITES